MSRSVLVIQRFISCAILGGSLSLVAASSLRALPKLNANSVPPSSFQEAGQSRGMSLVQQSVPTTNVLSTLEAHFVPPYKPQPDQTESSATRDRLTCTHDAEPFKIFASPEGYGLSTQARPAIAVQISPTLAKGVTLVFQNEAEQFYERATFPVDELNVNEVSNARVNHLHRFSLPNNTPGLKPFKLYRWFVVIHCEETVQPDDPVFSGWIEYRPARVNSPQGFQQLAWIERIKWYGQQGYWYDMVDQLVQ